MGETMGGLRWRTMEDEGGTVGGQWGDGGGR